MQQQKRPTQNRFEKNHNALLLPDGRFSCTQPNAVRILQRAVSLGIAHKKRNSTGNSAPRIGLSSEKIPAINITKAGALCFIHFDSRNENIRAGLPPVKKNRVIDRDRVMRKIPRQGYSMHECQSLFFKGYGNINQPEHKCAAANGIAFFIRLYQPETAAVTVRINRITGQATAQNQRSNNMKIYLYGMILATNSFRLKEFVTPDEYSEIEESFRFPGGETGTCGTVLSSLGAEVVLDGTHIGTNVAPLIRSFYKDRTVALDCLTFDGQYQGIEDYVLISGDTRTPMGTFAHFYDAAFRKGIKHWNAPCEKAIAAADAAAIDPFFGEDSERAARYCVKHNKPYVTIDCKYDSYLHKNAAVSVISGEGIQSNYPGKTREELFPLFQENGGGLTVITHGGKEFAYGRKGGTKKLFSPFSVAVKSTLGAGDTFKAGCTYALAHGMSDSDLVRFASACSAVAISRYPSQLDPPRMEEIEALLKAV